MKIILLNDQHYGCSGTRSVKIHEQFISLLADKIVFHGVELILVAGDTGTTKQDDLEKFFKLLRSKVSIPVLIVFGNHCYWDENPPHPLKAPRTYHQLRELHDELCREFDLHYLENGPFKLRNIQFSGYDGWYRSINPVTNDVDSPTHAYMRRTIEGVPTHLYLNARAHKECERVLNEASPVMVNVCVSHFDSTTTEQLSHGLDGYDPRRGDNRHLQALSELYDFIFYGHTHRAIDEKFGKARILSSGSDYLHPVGLVVNIPESPDGCRADESPVIERFHLSWTKRTSDHY
ncbi:metallophosphoesterase [Bdellovibrio sp. BCCA]|uniref:metallophosphoesterase n=1 Tax=Bdellovibrio sp. BCCA TaxID=3136281 RepID=UPI0030F1B708